jgi:hypothetical protein
MQQMPERFPRRQIVMAMKSCGQLANMFDGIEGSLAFLFA